MKATPFSYFVLLAVFLALSSCQTNPDGIAAKREAPLDVQIYEDIPYTSERALDIYAPTEAGPWPLVVAFHGGSVTKRTLKGLSESIAEMGAVVFTPDWRSRPPPSDAVTGGWEDAACAIRFARAHSEEYGGSPARLVVIGHSAGGAVGATVTLAGSEFDGDCNVTGQNANADGFVGLDGAYDILEFVPESRYEEGDPNEWRRISPFSYMDQSYYQTGVKFELFVGLEQQLLEHAQRLQEGLSAMGYEVNLIQLPGVGHMEMSMSRAEFIRSVFALLYP